MHKKKGLHNIMQITWVRLLMKTRFTVYRGKMICQGKKESKVGKFIRCRLQLSCYWRIGLIGWFLHYRGGCVDAFLCSVGGVAGGECRYYTRGKVGWRVETILQG